MIKDSNLGQGRRFELTVTDIFDSEVTILPEAGL